MSTFRIARNAVKSAEYEGTKKSAARPNIAKAIRQDKLPVSSPTKKSKEIKLSTDELFPTPYLRKEEKRGREQVD